MLVSFELASRSLRSVTLSAHAKKALEIAKKHRIPMPTPKAADMPAASATKPNMPTYFNDRSFMKSGLAQQIDQFLRGLQNAYDSVGKPFVFGGQVQCNKKLPSGKSSKIEVPWTDVCSRVPSFFMKECGHLQGFRFSQAVHGVLVPLVPKGRAHSVFCCPCIAFFPVRKHSKLLCRPDSFHNISDCILESCSRLYSGWRGADLQMIRAGPLTA